MTGRESQVRERLLELGSKGGGDRVSFEDQEEYDHLLEELSRLVKGQKL